MGRYPSLTTDSQPKCQPDSIRVLEQRQLKKGCRVLGLFLNLSSCNGQVLDARDPAAYRCPEVERYVRAAGANKKIILLLNKIGESAVQRK